MTNKAGEQPTITQAIRDSLMTFWAAGAHAARHNKEAPPQAFDREAARLVALIDTRTTSLAAQEELVEALRAAQPIVEADYYAAKDTSDSDWIGQSKKALDKINAALSAIKGDKS